MDGIAGIAERIVFPKHDVQYNKGERQFGQYAVTDSLKAQFTQGAFSSVQFSLCAIQTLGSVVLGGCFSLIEFKNMPQDTSTRH